MKSDCKPRLSTGEILLVLMACISFTYFHRSEIIYFQNRFDILALKICRCVRPLICLEEGLFFVY